MEVPSSPSPSPSPSTELLPDVAGVERSGGRSEQRGLEARAPASGSPTAMEEPSSPSTSTELLPDVAGAVLRRLSLEDRKSWNSLSNSWRQLAMISRPIPRLPVLFLANLRCSSLTISGAMSPLRSLDLPVAAQDCVGCFQDWVLVLKKRVSSAPEYLLINPFNRMSSLFISPRPASGVGPCKRRFILIESTPFFATLSPSQPGDGDRPFDKVIFSDSPYPGSSYTVAAATHDGLMLRQGIHWFSCSCLLFQGDKDLAFVDGRLFVLMSRNGDLFAFDFQKQSEDVPIVAGIHKIRLTVPVLPDLRITRNLIGCNGRLLLVVRSSLRTNTWDDVLNFSVFQLDVTTVPPQYLQLHSLNGDNIFLSYTSSKMFAAKLLDEIQGDKILAVDKNLEHVVFTYRITDDTREAIPITLTEDDQGAATSNMLWVFQE